MSGVPYIFGNATTSIPLSQLDVNFATNATLGNATVGLGNTTTTVGNLTVQNVTLSSTNGDANIHGLTVGQGGGSVSTNTAVGASALAGNTSGASNTSLGYQALYSNTTAYYNTAVGYQALYASNHTADVNGLNTGIGYQAGYVLTTGQVNTLIGFGAANNLTTGSNNTHVGTQTASSSSSVNYEIVIGYNITGKGANTGFISPNGGGMYQGNNSTLWSVTSDQRLKKNIVDNTVGLTAINGIKVRNFEYRLPDEITDLDKFNAVAITGVQIGPIAQELQQVLPDCVKTESTGVMSVDPSDVLWHLVTAVQQLSAQVTALQAKVGV
jgi:hypothetical protein